MTKKYQAALATKMIIKDQSLLRHEDIKQHILVLPELAAYIPPLLPDEYKQLEENIQKNGCREALLVWEATSDQLPESQTSEPVYVLIDGHNRYEICQRNKLDFKVHLMSFPSLEEVKFFMIDNQLGRRNLTPEQVSYLRGLRYLREKQGKGKYDREEQKGQNDLYESDGSEISQNGTDEKTRETTAHRLGKQFNVSEKTIKRDAAFAQGLERLTPAFKQDILSNKIKVDKSLVQRAGQLDKEIEAIGDLAKLEQLSQVASATSKPTDATPNRKSTELKNKLRQLVTELESDEANTTEICEQLIKYARLLQKGE